MVKGKQRSLLLLVGLILIVTRYCPAEDIYVSTKGNDHNPGTREKPFATINQAKQFLRNIHSPVTVFIRGGVYYLTEPVLFSAQDARKTNEKVTYKSFPGEKVSLSGGALLHPKWKAYKTGIYRALINENFDFDQLYINGKLQRMARYPNYNPASTHFGGFSEDVLSTERINKWKDPTGGFIHALHKHEWGGYHYRITGKDEKGGLKLEGGYQNNRQMGMHDKYRFVENIFEELDTAGEWFYNRKEKMLYYFPPAGLNINTAIVETVILKSLFEFRGSEQQPVTNITLEGFELKQVLRTFMETKEPLLRSDWTIYRGGTVVFEGAVECSVRNCYFNAVGGNAVFFSNYNRKDEVSGCRIENCGAGGVCFVGDPAAVRSPSFEYNKFVLLAEMDMEPGPKTNNYPSGCLVYDNLMSGLGQVEKQIAGVEISMSMDITVSHNTIYNVPRSGINISEGTWGGHMIEFNDVFNTVLETGDHGSFNSWGRDRYWHPNYDSMQGIARDHPDLILADVIKTITLRNNRFRCDHGWDIDLDDGSSNYHIYNNVCLNGGLKLREGFHRTVENNIMINNSFHPHVWFKDSDDIFRYNIVSKNYFPIQVKYWGREVDSNFFSDKAALNKAQQNGTDKNSVWGDQNFINPSTGDFEVTKGSAAFRTGFKNFSMNEFGVVSPALKKIAMKVTMPVMQSAASTSKQSTVQWHGIQVKNLETLGERSATGMDKETGVLVLQVGTGSDYTKLLKLNDVIIGYQNDPVKDVSTLLKLQEKYKETKHITLTIFRNQRTQEVIIKGEF